jgi:hypothetical protein
MSQIITNANAPIVEFTVILDNRYNPPAIALKANMPVPAKVAEKTLLFCVAQLIDQEIAAEAKASKPADTPPNLPDPEKQVM